MKLDVKGYSSLRIVLFVVFAMAVSTGINARDMVTHSASWKYQSENLNYRLQYQAKYQALESLRLHYGDTVVSMSSEDARKFAALSASLFTKEAVIKKTDTIVSSAPIIDIFIECAPRMEDKAVAQDLTVCRQPSCTYSHEYLALEQFVDDAVAPYLYTEDGVWRPGAVENYPEYIGGNAALLDYFAKNLRWPPELAEMCIVGNVILKLEITADGSIGKIRVHRTPHELMSDECIRVLRTLPEKCFKPATRKGVAVPCWYIFRIMIDSQYPRES